MMSVVLVLVPFFCLKVGCVLVEIRMLGWRRVLDERPLSLRSLRAQVSIFELAQLAMVGMLVGANLAFDASQLGDAVRTGPLEVVAAPALVVAATLLVVPMMSLVAAAMVSRRGRRVLPRARVAP